MSTYVVNVKQSINLCRNGPEQIGEQDIGTDYSGTVIIAGKFAKQKSYSLSVITTTTFNNYSVVWKVKGTVNLKGTVCFNSKLQFRPSDIEMFQKGIIRVQSFTLQNIPLPYTTVKFYILDSKEYEVAAFEAFTDEKGEQSVNFLLPSQGQCFVVLFTAQKEGYKDVQQQNRKTKDFVLQPQNNYDLGIYVKLLQIIEYTITAQAIDQFSNPLPEVQFELHLGTQAPYYGSSSEDGKFSETMEMDATEKIHVKISITKLWYFGVEKEYDQLFNLTPSSHYFHLDLGTIKLQQQPIEYTITVQVIDQFSNPIPQVKFEFRFGTQAPYYGQSSEDGIFSETMKIDVAEKIHVRISITKLWYFGVEKEYDQLFILTPPSHYFDQDLGTIKLQIRPFEYTITAQVIDQFSNPIPEVKFELHLGTQAPYYGQSGKSGKFSETLIVDATEKIHVRISITKLWYLGAEKEYNQLFILTPSSHYFHNDLGTIILLIQPYEYTITALVIDQFSNPIPEVEFELYFGTQGPYYGQSGKDGKLSETMVMVATEKILVRISITKLWYFGVEKEYDQLFILTSSSHYFYHDLGTIKLLNRPFEYTITAQVIDQFSNPIPEVKFEFHLGTEGPYYGQSGKDGKLFQIIIVDVSFIYIPVRIQITKQGYKGAEKKFQQYLYPNYHLQSDLGTITLEKYQLPFRTITNNIFYSTYCFSLLIVSFWTYSIIIGINNFIIAGCVCNWYWQKQNNGLEFLKSQSLNISCRRCFVFHFGSVALGAFIFGLISPFRAVVEYLYVMTLDNLVQCAGYGKSEWILIYFQVLSLLYSVFREISSISKLKYLCLNQYDRDGFCDAASKSVELMSINQSTKFAGFGDYVSNLARTIIALLISMLFCFSIREFPQLIFLGIVTNPYNPTMVLAIIVFVIVSLVTNILFVAIKSIIYLYCIDERIALENNSSNGAESCPAKLKQILEDQVFAQNQ